MLDVSICSGDIRDQSRKLSEIAPKMDAFRPSQFFGDGPSRNCTRVITPASRHVARKKFREDTPTSPEVIKAHTLNFKPNFKFLRLIFFFLGGGGTPSQLGCALGSLGQSLARLNISGRSTPNGRNAISRKMSTWVGQYEPLELFCSWTKVHQIVSPNVEGAVVDQVFFRCSICRSVPEIFAIKVESCQK